MRQQSEASQCSKLVGLGGKIVDRRELLLATFAAPFLRAQKRSREANVQIMEAVWQGARIQFYDPRMRGVDWNAVRKEFLRKVQTCSSDNQLLSLLREMLRRLRNSHIFLYTREEWDWQMNIVPICFAKTGNRVFVRYVLRGKKSGLLAPLEFGDEIIAVDGLPAARLRPVTLARLEAVKGNPNFGPPGSVAEVEIRRASARQVVKVNRVARPSGFEAVVTEHPTPNIIHVRFFCLDSSEIPVARLRQLSEEIITARGLVLDVRSCVGGDKQVSNFIAAGLIGPNKPLFRNITREGQETFHETPADVPRFVGPVAVLTNANTESEPEILTAVCKEYACARIFGERTAGAFNGWTVAVELPYGFALYALPYTRSVSPKGIEYEGRGIEPDEPVANLVKDFEEHHDQPLMAAIGYLQHGIRNKT
jgi:carboxyl-terminal processing protease